MFHLLGLGVGLWVLLFLFRGFFVFLVVAIGVWLLSAHRNARRRRGRAAGP